MSDECLNHLAAVCPFGKIRHRIEPQFQAAIRLGSDMVKKSNAVGRSASGLYFRNLGYTDSGSQKKFYLGRDERKAVTANAQLERLWDAVLARFERQKGIIRLRYKDGIRTTEESAAKPVWDEAMLTIGKAIIDDRAIAYVTAPSSSAGGRMVWLKQLRDDVPFIRIELDAADAAEEVVEYAEARCANSGRPRVNWCGRWGTRPCALH